MKALAKPAVMTPVSRHSLKRMHVMARERELAMRRRGYHKWADCHLLRQLTIEAML